MAEFKIVISDPKSGKSLQKELKEDAAKPLIGKKIGEAFKGESIDMAGYEFVITGGSDAAGFPMRWDVAGTARKRITAVTGVGVNNKKRKPNPKKKGWRTMEGMRLKKTVAGNTIHAKIAQINLKVTKQGKDPLFEAKPAEEAKGGDVKVDEQTESKPVAEEKKTEAPAAEAPVEEKKEEAPKEEAPAEEKKEEAPVEEKKEEEAPAEEAPAEEKKEEAPAEKSDDSASEELDKLDEEVKKDEEEVKKDNEEIKKIEEELKEVAEEAPAEEKKEEAPAEDAPVEEKKEEAPAEEKKEE